MKAENEEQLLRETKKLLDTHFWHLGSEIGDFELADIREALSDGKQTKEHIIDLALMGMEEAANGILQTIKEYREAKEKIKMHDDVDARIYAFMAAIHLKE